MSDELQPEVEPQDEAPAHATGSQTLIEKALEIDDEPETAPVEKIAMAMNDYERRMVYQKALVASIAAMIGEPQYSSKEHIVREADAYARLAAEAAAEYMKTENGE